MTKLKDKNKAKEHLITELVELRQRVAELEKAEIERKRAEEVFLSGKKYKELVDLLPQAIFEIDESGTLAFVNRHGLEVSGYSQEDIDKGLNVLVFFIPEDRDSIMEHFRKILSGEKSGGSEYTALRKDGSTFPVIIYFSPIIREKIPVGLRGVCIDITKIKQVDEGLRLQALILKNIHDGIIVTDLESCIIGWNRAAERIFGYSEKEVSGKTMSFITTHVVDATVRDGSWSGEIEFVRKNGTEGVCETVIVPLLDEQGNIIATVGVNRDITDRKQAEGALRESEEKYRTLFKESRDPVYISTRDGKIIDVNQSYLELFGYTKKELKNMTIQKTYLNAADRGRFQQYIEKNGSVRDYEMDLRKKDGTKMNCLITASVRRDASGTIIGYQGIIRDITKRKQQEQQLAYMATHDILTGLPNRMIFNDRLSLGLARAHRTQKKLAVMLLDLDRFKDINDRYGHKVGDLLLQAVGDRLKNLMRKSDTIARMGGDEFSLLLQEINQIDDTFKIAKKILKVFQKPFVLESNELHITTSIGIAIFPNDGEDIDTLLKKADIAMYHAKEKGRDNYQHYTPTMDTKTYE